MRHTPQGVTEPTLALCSPAWLTPRQVSARFRRIAGRTRHFAPAPFAAASASDSGLLPLIPTAANCRDRQRQRCPQRFQRPRDFVRPRHQHYGARLRLSPKTAAIARATSSGQDARNNREIGHFRTASISQATLQRTETTELTAQTMFGLTPRRWTSRPAVSAAPVTISRPSFRSVPAAGSQRIGFRAGATRRELK